MELNEKETLYAYGSGVALVVLTGTLTVVLPGLENWEKKLMYAGAFILFIVSEPLWIWGKGLLKRNEK